jgi:hypothetical protein
VALGHGRRQRQRPIPRELGRGRALLRRPPDSLLATHAAYYVATGVWPLLSRRTFERVTGPKADFWLAQTVGALIATVGIGLAESSRRRNVSPELRTIAILSAASLSLIDIIFVGRRRIRPIYLLDAGAEVALIAAWLWPFRPKQA